MSPWSVEIRRRLAAFDFEPHRLGEIVEELTLHVEDRVRDLRTRGLSEQDAASAVRAELDQMDVGAFLRHTRSVRVTPPAPGIEAARSGWWHSIASDIRYGLRTLRHQPVLTTVALAILALGIGGSAGIFSVVNAVILRPLPFSEPERLVSFWGTAPEMGLPVVNYPDALYNYHRLRSRTLEKLAVHTGVGFTLTGSPDPTRVSGQNVTSEFFSVLGVRPALGRDFRPEEATHGNNLVAILSDGLWQRQFGGDRAVIGTSISLDGIATVVVGVMPRGFDFPNHAELWVPLGIDPSSTNCWCYDAIGRMRPGVSTDDVAREVDALNEAFFDERNPN